MYSPQNQLSDLLSKPSEKESLKWYTMGAKAGHAMCQNDLGTLYKRKGDYATSIKWIRKAAEQNVPLAQFNMGQRYIFGHGVPKSFPEAMVWFRRAADGGECKAQNSLGIMYRDGEGLPERRPAEAAKWFKKGAKPRNQMHSQSCQAPEVLRPIQRVRPRMPCSSRIRQYCRRCIRR